GLCAPCPPASACGCGLLLYLRAKTSRPRWGPAPGGRAWAGEEAGRKAPPRERGGAVRALGPVGSRSALGERGLVGVGLDRARGGGKGHEIVIPGVAVHEHVGGRSQFDALDQVVVDVGVETGLLEGVEGSGGGASADEPGLVVHVRVVAELAVLP